MNYLQPKNSPTVRRILSHPLPYVGLALIVFFYKEVVLGLLPPAGESTALAALRRELTGEFQKAKAEGLTLDVVPE